MNPPIKLQILNLKRHEPSAFTLVELLVVILIIGVLVGILIPVVSTVQKSAKAASSQAGMTALIAAIESYYSDFKAYPGPLTDQEIYTTGTGPTITGLTTAETAKITGTENLVLALLGGLRHDGTAIIYDRNALDSARGAGSLNPAQPKVYRAYIATASLYKATDGLFKDDAGTAADSPIPEFVDSFNSPLPILYLRAARGKPVAANNVIMSTSGATVATTPFDLRYIVGYVGTGTANAGAGSTSIGVGKDLPEYYQNGATVSKRSVTPFPYHGLRSATPITPVPQRLNDNTAAYNLPFDAYTYFCDPSSVGPAGAAPIASHRARKNDSYILIGAGKDRVYGTDDDITNFGNVSP